MDSYSEKWAPVLKQIDEHKGQGSIPHETCGRFTGTLVETITNEPALSEALFSDARFRRLVQEKVTIG